MLRDRYRQLLTASIDGELTSQERRLLARLLSRSAEARQLLEQLQADTRALRRLSRPPLPADLTGSVLRTIAERRLTPGRRRTLIESSVPVWMGPLASWAAAASVLILLGASSYLYFAVSLSRPEKTEIAHALNKQSTQESLPEQLGPPILTEDAPQRTERANPVQMTDPSSTAKSREIVKNRQKKPAADDAGKQSTSPKEEIALTNRLEMFHLDLVPDVLPVVLQVHDLEQKSAQKRLQAELLKDIAFRMELPSQNGTKALERVQKAAQKLHFGLILDKQAQERMKGKLRTNYVLYIEDLTPEEWVRFVQQVGLEDRKSAAGKPAELRFDRLVLTRMTAQDRKELSTLLGIDPTTKPPRSADATAVDSSKPLSDLTAQQLSQFLAGQGGKPRPQVGQPGAKTPSQYILVLAYNPVRPSPGSDEIKHFLESRKPTRSGTIRILLVLRS